MRLLAPALLLSLAACVVTPEPNTPSDAVCSNDNLDAFKGQAVDSSLGARLLDASGANSIRWVQPGTMVTMEFNPQRVTVQLTADNRIDSARCG